MQIKPKVKLAVGYAWLSEEHVQSSIMSAHECGDTMYMHASDRRPA